ncbi:uncharacterized protein LOC123565736 [Mercenaria mercenaria]|uniref:uncharacterized protein LOC123565736 n=1 Tax=Mercenaria mercenaria TaxID=6596 RepID=UPI00234FA2E2|nr:uncharacterized protein LOC123565736 [Mercenaria mercenaria]
MVFVVVWVFVVVFVVVFWCLLCFWCLSCGLLGCIRSCLCCFVKRAFGANFMSHLVLHRSFRYKNAGVCILEEKDADGHGDADQAKCAFLFVMNRQCSGLVDGAAMVHDIDYKHVRGRHVVDFTVVKWMDAAT